MSSWLSVCFSRWWSGRSSNMRFSNPTRTGRKTLRRRLRRRHKTHNHHAVKFFTVNVEFVWNQIAPNSISRKVTGIGGFIHGSHRYCGYSIADRPCAVRFWLSARHVGRELLLRPFRYGLPVDSHSAVQA
ncbi:hypothetical protein AGR1B_Lc30160 [Agrobacterium fabacearum S56]|nr:hypothetical protein AGR1B_Lc30160 [Agrobacterium fabacearum S56]